MKTILLYIFLLSCYTNIAQTTSIPDIAFEQALINAGIDNSDAMGFTDGFVYDSDVSSITSLDVSSQSISDLTGIEAFTSLEILQCWSNNLTSLDLTGNTNLKVLNCEINQITNIVFPSSNLIETLVCYSNSLTTLDLSNQTNLQYVKVEFNNLTNLDLKNGNNFAIGHVNATNNPSLECVTVDNPVSASTGSGVYSNWITDSGIRFSISCNTDIYVPDDNFEQYLISSNYDWIGVLDNYIPNDSNVQNAIQLTLNNLGISDLTGVEGFSSLERLYLFNNNLNSIDVSNNSQLKILNIGNNNITNLDLSSNVLLEELRCGGNQIAGLDLSSNSQLADLRAANNQLTVANLKNGNNNILTVVNLTNNSTLTCIDVDNANKANNGNDVYATWQKDVSATYSEDCAAALSVVDFKIDYEFSIYPNPTSNFITIKSSNTIKNVEIYNLNGQLIRTIDNLNHDNYYSRINTSKLTSGVYVVVVKSKNNMKGEKKLIKL